MPSKYIGVKDIGPLDIERVIRLRCLRCYEIPENRGSTQIKSKECLVCDEEGASKGEEVNSPATTQPTQDDLSDKNDSQIVQRSLLDEFSLLQRESRRQKGQVTRRKNDMTFVK
ncbi:PREDICTED: uncharacterized protein LOC109183643 [Ipomoea nil]|uniref:uncharacterized protein LOC109183643 n=1 Tax=Ipomoea nil TaxID=35883 RepID=UPI00090156B6|nr:PREDICTED: uncharacterized protein LOC109183643 [Ipomoea nil]